MNVMKHYSTIRNNEGDGFRKTWNDLYELIQSKAEPEEQFIQ